MLESFSSVIETVTGSMAVSSAAMCTVASIIFGVVIACAYVFSYGRGQSHKYSKNFVITLVLLPVIVQVVIALVNGSLGTGVAIMGAFSLVRFRSIPGTAKEICAIFFAMATGVATGMGYITYGGMFVIVVGVLMLIMGRVSFGSGKAGDRQLRITIPENLDYTEVFDEVFDEYTNSNTLDRVKTTNMGSMYELRYTVNLKDEKKEKEFIDALRIRNGNLTIISARQVDGKEEL